MATVTEKGANNTEQKRNLKPFWIALAFAALIIIVLIPNGGDLPVVGQRALAILAFAVILWVTEAVSYPVSSAMILALIAVLLGLAPSMEDPSVQMGTSNALKLALGGFSNSAVALVGVALFLAAAMQITNLHKRIALWILSMVGTKTNALVFGAILVAIALAFVVPSATARAGAVVPILLGIVAAFGLTKESKLAALLVITATQAVSIWNIGIKTAAAQNLVALGFIKSEFGVDITWSEWFMYAAPFSAIMSVVLFFVMIKLIKPETDNIASGKDVIRQQLVELGPLKRKEITLIITTLVLLFFWSTEGKLHPFDTTTITIVAIAFLLTPKVGVFNWQEASSRIDWGTLIVFAVGISLGSTLLNTKGAAWLSDTIFGSLGLDTMPILATIALVTVFNIIIHLGFASATSLASALIPVFIALALSLPMPVENQIGFVIIQQFVICFGFLLPVSAPQNMLAYGTGTFTTKDFLKSGLPLTIFGFILILIFSATYWKWIGLL
ncbi:DASS family sodium-coupled anion symporter [Solibacillus daqui]|uniref:DASS family sodium-coupled anion symporter n=1 Tax=Solibacillus daqui TaxID=2912187 RepID=UPI002366445F|nr:DASS family sodium-coupled anion symporter [Solibacillus daqui]